MASTAVQYFLTYMSGHLSQFEAEGIFLGHLSQWTFKSIGGDLVAFFKNMDFLAFCLIETNLRPLRGRKVSHLSQNFGRFAAKKSVSFKSIWADCKEGFPARTFKSVYI